MFLSDLILIAIFSLIIFQSHRQRKKIIWFNEKIDLTEKIALVTGGTSGIGFSTALQLAKRGCSVYLISRCENNLTWMRSISGNENINFIKVNFERLDQVRSFGETLSDRFPTGIDLFINSAGIALSNIENTIDNIEKDVSKD